MKKLALSFVCVTLILAMLCMIWLYQTQPNVLLNSTLGKIVSPSGGPPPGYGNAITARESSVVLAKVQASGLLASGAYNGRIAVATSDAQYTVKEGFRWPWNNIIEVIHVNQGSLKRQSHAVFQDRKDFVFSPSWSKNGKLLFSVGERDQYSSFDFAQLDTTTNNVHPIATGLASGPYVPSPDGRFVAYVEGGHSYPFAPAEERFLKVRDMKTDKVVSKSLGLSNFPQLSWLSSKVLLFNLHDAIWQISTSSGQSKLFRKNAFSPTVSPDSKWFVYLSYDNPSTQEVERAAPATSAKPQRFYLVLSSADQKTVRTVTTKLLSLGPDVVWAPNSQRLALYEKSLRNSSQTSKKAEDVVRIYDVKSKKLTRIGKLQRPPQKLLAGSIKAVSCAPLIFTKDGKFLLFSIRDFGGKASGTTLAAFDTKNGATQSWFFTSTEGLSWLEN